MENQGTINLEKGVPPHSSLNKGILRRQMDKCSVTLAKNMHVKLLNSICRACFDFVYVMADCLCMNSAYMAVVISQIT